MNLFFGKMFQVNCKIFSMKWYFRNFPEKETTIGGCRKSIFASIYFLFQVRQKKKKKKKKQIFHMFTIFTKA